MSTTKSQMVDRDGLKAGLTGVKNYVDGKFFSANSTKVRGEGLMITAVSTSGNQLVFTKGTPHASIAIATDTATTVTPNFGGEFTAVTSVTRDENGHVTTIETTTVTLPNDPKYVNQVCSTSDGNYPLLARSTTSTSNSKEEVAFNTKVTVNHSTGAMTAFSFTATSSRKFKEDIQPSTLNALELINSVDVVTYRYIADESHAPHIGFIAEDTDKLLSGENQDKMDYTNCIGTLIKAVQELSEKNDELSKKIDALMKNK